MSAWNPQHFLNAGRKANVSENILANAVAIANATSAVAARSPPIFSLGHLSHLTGLDVTYLRGLIARNGDDPYRQFKIRKRPVPGQPPRFRFIAVPEPKLMELQRWISKEILSHAPCHPASTAYAPGSRLVNAAKRHTGAKWLIKIDVRDFFESITEIDVYRVFLERGYQPLPSLELARICTRLRDEHREPEVPLPQRRRAASPDPDCIPAYYSSLIGTLAQGAPTSPMLANLVSKRLDEAVQAIAQKFSVRYTRYADDLTFSTTEKTFGRARAVQLVGEVYAALGGQGLSPNTSKTLIVPPGARKIVLGLLVDGKQVRLSREFRSKMRMHLHYLTLPEVGPRQHASKRGFASAEGLRQYLLGLIAFAGQIDPAYADTLRIQFAALDWS